MAFWKPTLNDLLKSALSRVEVHFNAARGAVKQRLGALAPPRIMPYRGFGTPERFHLMGRVLEDRKISSPQDDDPWWLNVRNMYRRFAIYSFANVRIRAEFDAQSLISRTDAEGRFAFHWPLCAPLDPDRRWHEVRLSILDELSESRERVKATGEVYVPPVGCSFGVISDIDDTIIHSSATDFWQMVRISLAHNARSRTPLPGVAGFYRALERGPVGSAPNPFFYVSSSAWNMYDLLADFLDLHGLPTGPLFLRNLGVDEVHPLKSGHKHKLDRIREIMRTYPTLPFLLIGDAGQDDPALYLQAVEDFPGRVKAIYIRTVSNRLHDAKVHKIAEEVARHGASILLVNDTHEALEHAAAAGYLQREALPPIVEELDLAVRE